MKFLVLFVLCVLPMVSVQAASKSKHSNESLRSAGLSDKEISIYRRGRINQSRRAIGMGFGYVLGFGSGHAITSQWTDLGWLFTFGELAGLTGIIAGSIMVDRAEGNKDAIGYTLVGVGAAAYVGLRIWEVVDVASRPFHHNKRYDKIKEKLERSNLSLSPVVDPNVGYGALARFQF